MKLPTLGEPTLPATVARPYRWLPWVGVFSIAGLLVALSLVWKTWSSKTTLPEFNLEFSDPGIASAVAAARQAVEEKPRSAAAWGYLGMVLRAHDYNSEASACFQQAEALDPRDPRWPYLWGLILLRGDPDASLSCLRCAAGLARSEPAVSLRLAGVLAALGQNEEAEGLFQAVLKSDPDNARAHLGLARLLYDRGDTDASLRELQACLRQAPWVRSAHILLAELYFRAGKQEAATEELRLADQTRGEVPWPDPFVEDVERLRVGVNARVSLATTLLAQGRAGQAVELLQETAQVYPDSYEAHITLGFALVRLGDYAAAESALRQAVQCKADAFDAWLHLGIALQGQKQLAAAVASYDKALALKPQHAQTHFNRGHCLKQLGDLAGAIAAFRNVVRYKPDLAEGHRDLGEALGQCGATAEALAELKQALELKPGDGKVQNLLTELSKAPR